MPLVHPDLGLPTQPPLSEDSRHSGGVLWMVPGAQLACEDRPRHLVIVAVTAEGLVDCPRGPRDHSHLLKEGLAVRVSVSPPSCLIICVWECRWEGQRLPCESSVF